MVERGGRLRAVATKDTGSNTLMTLARNNIDIDATIYTDEHMPYRPLPKLGFKHESVNHGVKEFVNGMASTNTAESFWSHLKRGINGIYHHVSAKHQQFYCDEYSFRWNTREMTDGERFEAWFDNIGGKRLMYKTLTKKSAMFLKLYSRTSTPAKLRNRYKNASIFYLRHFSCSRTSPPFYERS